MPITESPKSTVGDSWPRFAPPHRRYRIEEEVARGGMGIIYRGWDNLLQCTLAIKVLLEAHRDKPELRWRFLEEARITARLQHPCIVPVYDLGEFLDGAPYFAMRLVQGVSLSTLLGERANPTDDLPHLVKVFEQTCQGVAHAHSRGVIHRDLKPGNVMVAPFGVVQVMDWGVAKEGNREASPAGEPPDLFLDACSDPGPSASTEVGQVLGTPAYMAPEQARGEIDNVDERSDVFGLGAILCEILTGSPPYFCQDGRQAHRSAVRGDLAQTQAALAACAGPHEMVALALRCLNRDPAQRPIDGTEVAREVTAYLESDQRRAERDLARFFELSLDMFCLAGLDGFFHRVNPNFSRVLGHPEEELLRRPFFDFVHPDDQTSTSKALDKLAYGMPVVRFRNRYRHADGSYRLFEWTAKSIPEEGIIFAVARDVTGD